MRFSPHPRSHGFTWVDRTGPRRRLSDAQVRSFDERGFVVVEDAFDRKILDAVIAEIDPVEARVEDFVRGQKDGRVFIARADEITFAPHLVTRSETLRRFCSGPVFQDLCHDLVGPDVRLYWDQAVYKKPGTEVPFPWHQDNGYTYLEPQQYLTCWVALTDATVDHGCPWIVPGLHREGTLLHHTTELGFVCLDDVGDRAVAAEARAGSIVVFSSLTPHATGPNCTADIRKAYIVQFAPDGARMFPRDASGRESEATTPLPAADPTRQYPVLVAGRPVPPPALDPR